MLLGFTLCIQAHVRAVVGSRSGELSVFTVTPRACVIWHNALMGLERS